SANTQQWLIAYWHHPPYSKGSHDSDSESELQQMRQYANPILESHGVDLVLSGHSHSYERSYLLNGHYGSSSTLTSAMILDKGDGRVDGTGAYEKPAPLTPNKGAVYTVAGSSGQTSGGSLDHPAMYLSLNVLGSLVSGTAQAVTFSASGLPTAATASFSPTACTPTCSITRNISTTSSTATGTSTVTVTGTGGVATKTTSLSLTVNPVTSSFNFSF